MTARDEMFATWAEASAAHARAKRQGLVVGPIRRRVESGEYVFERVEGEGRAVTYEPPETVIRDAMETFGYTRNEAIAEITGIDRAFGIADEEEG